ncbi:Integrase [hydrothermal vent metagenome]|uniref:Integrase n=1 Tax=hydrothermal vent metagenome TaxID=652676 RepID=A0A3B0TM82_9ZZZZ
MCADAALKQLKSNGKPYTVAERDGMYVHIATSGSITFRYDYRLNGRRETLAIGSYGRVGISLLAAREKCLDARRKVAEGKLPAQENRGPSAC